MRLCLLVLCILGWTSAMAVPDWRTMSKDCAKRATDAEVANCLRDGVSAQEKEDEAENKKKTEEEQREQQKTVQLRVRETASSITSFAGNKQGEKGASFSAQRDNGVDATLAKIALFGVFRPLFGGQLQPFVGAAWSRDGATNPKKDVRQLTVGAAGLLYQTSGPGHEAFTLFHAVQLSRRYDLHGTTDGQVARVHFDLSWAPLSSGALLGGVAVLPHVAGLWQRRTDGGVESGNWRSAYAGLLLEKPFGLGGERFKLSAVARKLYDASVPSGNAERRVQYANVSLDYYFYDPDNKTAPLQPSLFITRETGTDFLEYGKPVNKTTAGVRLKFN
jgi:hypothetical protein